MHARRLESVLDTTGRHVGRPDRDLALELVRATEAAAILSAPHIGKGDKVAADGAAVDAMRAFLDTVNFDGVVVIGEGEKDSAPMLYNGEHVGNGEGPSADIAVDPIDGTSMTAQGRDNAISLIAVADRFAMLDASSVFYMDKLVTDESGIGVVDLREPVEANIRALAAAKHKSTADMVIAVLDRPRHVELIDRIRSTGAATRMLLDGDGAGGINAARDDTRIDMCVGMGGSPEGIVTACAIKAMGGFIQAKLMPSSVLERTRAEEAGLDVDRIYEADDLVSGDNTMFVATGVTDGGLVAGVQRTGQWVQTESIVLRSRSGTVRRITARHRAERWY